MYEFKYIIEKIKNAEFNTTPFKFLYIKDFLSDDHLKMLTSCEQININEQQDTKSLIKTLQKNNYQPIKFPGCTTSIKEYLEWYNNKNIKKLYNNEVVETFGMAFNLEKIQNPKVQELINFLNGEEFHNALHEKFNITRASRITTRIQKYLTGYEISPHPDIRSKCLTYLININTNENSNNLDIHTHLLKFKKDYEYIYDFWSSNEDIDRCWVPWDWCETIEKINENNSLVMFAPSNDTLHAVKLNYDHLPFQRTQLYGNLWFLESKKAKPSFYTDLI